MDVLPVNPLNTWILVAKILNNLKIYYIKMLLLNMYNYNAIHETWYIKYYYLFLLKQTKRSNGKVHGEM